VHGQIKKIKKFPYNLNDTMKVVVVVVFSFFLIYVYDIMYMLEKKPLRGRVEQGNHSK